MNGTCILIVIAFIVVLYYIKQNKQDNTETFMPVRGNIQEEINNRDKILTKVDDINVEAPYV